jgi:predicted DsbA family dithiol-disulfide isomerase
MGSGAGGRQVRAPKGRLGICGVSIVRGPTPRPDSGAGLRTNTREATLSELVLYHDFASPFSRLALAIARDAAGAARLELRLAPLELYPAPVPLPDPDTAWAEELPAALPLARELGLELVRPRRVPRTRKAHEAVAHARAHGLELAMAEALYDGLWRRDLDISGLDVVAGLGAEVGLDRDLLHVALGLDAAGDEVLAAADAAEAAGIDWVPTFRVGTAVAVGLFPPAELMEWIRACR